MRSAPTDHTAGGRAMAGGARLASRPHLPRHTGAAGLSLVLPQAERESLLFVPGAVDPAKETPLLVLLHGAGGQASQALALLRNVHRAQPVILLAPASSAFSWDVVLDDYGPDVEHIGAALEHVFDRYRIYPGRIGVAGFSDGASYALSLGLTNGDLFSHLIAFSPGFAAPTQQRDSPRVFISHGTGDQVLPVEPCGRRLAAALRRSGLDVQYMEFDGGHIVPHAIAAAAVHWFLEGAG